MSQEIDRSAATKLLNESLNRCSNKPVSSCLIKDTIDFVLAGNYCLTYRYIMFTALVAKAVNPAIDVLSLQAQDKSEGAYDPRSLAADVIFPFQKDLLGNILDGSNSDPLVNKPARFERLRKENPAKGGDPKKALFLLCDDLPRVSTRENAISCVDYIVSVLLIEKSKRDSKRNEIENSVRGKGMFDAHDFLDRLLNQGFGGAALVIATTAIFKLMYDDGDIVIVPHPVNQSGSSRRQFSDIDIYRAGKPFMAIELKDKPFTSSDVEHSAAYAFDAGAPSLLFVAGRQSNFAAEPPTYYQKTKNSYAKKGLYVGVTSIDSLMDIAFASNFEREPSKIITTILDTCERIGAVEAQIWIYSSLSNK